MRFTLGKLSNQWAVLVWQCSWRAEFIAACQDFSYSFFTRSTSQCLSKPRWSEWQTGNGGKFVTDSKDVSRKVLHVSLSIEVQKKMLPGLNSHSQLENCFSNWNKGHSSLELLLAEKIPEWSNYWGREVKRVTGCLPWQQTLMLRLSSDDSISFSPAAPLLLADDTSRQ